ncbi:MAG: hypothetical protein ACRC7V_01355 [Lachnospiraceae bacterium]
MKFYSNLYVGDLVINKRKVMHKLKHNIGQLQIYVISLSNETNQLECMHCAFLKQKILYREISLVVGIASSYEEALDLIVKITQEVVEKTNTANIKEYILANL